MEGRKITEVQKEAINYYRSVKSDMAHYLSNYLEYTDPITALNARSAIEKLLRRETKVGRSFPTSHTLPEIPRTIYVAVPTDRFENGTETLHVSDCLATTNIMRAVFSDRITFSLPKFTPICCPATLFQHILKSRALNRNPIKSRIERYLELELVTEADYIVRVDGLLDACDIVACPDKLLFSSLPDIVRKRIERHGVQHLYN